MHETQKELVINHHLTDLSASSHLPNSCARPSGRPARTTPLPIVHVTLSFGAGIQRGFDRRKVPRIQRKRSERLVVGDVVCVARPNENGDDLEKVRERERERERGKKSVL